MIRRTRLYVVSVLLVCMSSHLCGAPAPCASTQSPNADLFEAIKYNHTAQALKLLGSVTDHRIVDRDGMSPLMWAVVMQNEQVVEVLLSHGPDINLRCAHGQTALMFSAMQHKLDINVPIALLNAKADTRIKDHEGLTALHYAVLYQQPELVKLLIDNGADVNARTDYNDEYQRDTALLCAVNIGDLSTVRLLLERGANVDLSYPNPWYPIS